MQQHEYATWLLLQHLHSHCGKFTSKQFLTIIKSGTRFWEHMQQIACRKYELWRSRSMFLLLLSLMLTWCDFMAGVLPFPLRWRFVNPPCWARRACGRRLFAPWPRACPGCCINQLTVSQVRRTASWRLQDWMSGLEELKMGLDEDLLQ